jgi:hypothetical protein
MYTRIQAGMLAIAFMLILATIAVPAPASAQPPCQLFADDPFWDGSGNLVGGGGRINCSGTRTVTVLLRRDRPWLPDVTLAEVSKTGTIVFLAARHYCTRNTDMKVYTETRTSAGGKVQSGRLLTSC